MHKLVAEWVADGSVDGLRIDHVDGLADPGAYLRRLRALAPSQWIGVEKILADGETLPDWPVDGTTGYEIGALLTRLLTAAEGEAPLTALYHRFAGALDTFDEVEEDARHEVLEHWLAGDAKRVALALHRMCQDDLYLRDYSLRDASIAGARAGRRHPRLPHLRHGRGATDADVARGWRASASGVRTRRPDIPGPLVDLVARLFATGGDGPRGLEFVRRFQQLSTAAAAKAVEDTAAYRDARYLRAERSRLRSAALRDSRRRSSTTPSRAGSASIRAACAAPARTTRSAARTSAPASSVLSEMPELWAETVERWGHRSDAGGSTASPIATLEYYLYQTLVGAWPLTRERTHVHVEKAAREAKVFTDWSSPSHEYERALHHFVDGLFDDDGFIAELAAFVDVAASRRLDQGPVAAAAQAHDSRRARPVPRLRAVASHPRRSRQPPAASTTRAASARLEPAARSTAPEALARMDEGLPKLWTTSRDPAAQGAPLRSRGSAAGYTPLEVRGPAAARAVGVPARQRRRGGRADRGPGPRLAGHAGDAARRPLEHVLADTTIRRRRGRRGRRCSRVSRSRSSNGAPDDDDRWPARGHADQGGRPFSRVLERGADRIELCLFDERGVESRHNLVLEPGFIWHLFLPGDHRRSGLRLPRPRTVRSGTGPALQPGQAARRSVRQGDARATSSGATRCSRIRSAATSWPSRARDSAPERAPLLRRRRRRSTGTTTGGPGTGRSTPSSTSSTSRASPGCIPAGPEHLRGTYAGLATPAALERSRKLGVTTVELMPVHQFMHEPGLLDEGLRNYWGYHTYGFFAPHAEYAAADDRGGQVREFKDMVKAFHAAGLEVILDVVYNHTSEGNHLGPHLNFKGFDNPAYYHLVAQEPRYYMDYTGTGNSVNLRHPYVCSW